MYRDFPLGGGGELLSGVNITVNSFSQLGAYVGRFENISPFISRMNNLTPILTNIFLDAPPVGLASDPLEYSPPPVRLGQTRRYP